MVHLRLFYITPLELNIKVIIEKIYHNLPPSTITPAKHGGTFLAKNAVLSKKHKM